MEIRCVCRARARNGFDPAQFICCIIAALQRLTCRLLYDNGLACMQVFLVTDDSSLNYQRHYQGIRLGFPKLGQVGPHMPAYLAA